MRVPLSPERTLSEGIPMLVRRLVFEPGLLFLSLLLAAGCGNGEDVAPIPVTPVPPPPPPSQPAPSRVPANLRVSASGEDFIEWSWDAVEGAGGYRVQFSENEVFTDADEVISRTAAQLSYRREGLPPNASGYLRVQSVARAGEAAVTSDWSGHVAGVTAPPPGLLVTPEEYSLTEGETMTLSVRLTTQPTAPVMVATSVQVSAWRLAAFRNPPLRVVRGSRLTFDPDTWDARQTVTLRAEEDSAYITDEPVSIYLDVTSDDPSYEGAPRKVIPGVVKHDDPHEPGTILLAAPNRWCFGPPAGATWNYTARLSVMPTSDVTIEITSRDPGAVVVTGGRRLVFTRENFHEPQLVQITGVPGRNYAGATIRADASGGGYDGVSATLEFPDATPDEDDPAIVVSDTELSLLEGDVGSFTVRLSSEPEHATVVSVSTLNADALTILGGRVEDSCFHGNCGRESYKELSFARHDWDDPQEVELRAHEDDDTDDGRLVVFLSEVGRHVSADGVLTIGCVAGFLSTTVLILVEDDDPR